MIKAGARTGAGAGIVIALLVMGCAEDPPPKNELPQITSAQHSCEATTVMDLGEVLTGGEVTTLDENLVAVSVDIGGLGTRSLSAPAPLPEEVDPLETPQTWTFAVSPEERLLCSDTLVLTFTATDEKGETAVLSLPAAP